MKIYGYKPHPREGHAAAVVDGVMYVFGGRNQHGKDFGDLAAFRFSTQRWTTFIPWGLSPSPRSLHSMTVSGKEILVFGGQPSSNPKENEELCCLYTLDTTKLMYTDSERSTHPTEDDSGDGEESEHIITMHTCILCTDFL